MTSQIIEQLTISLIICLSYQKKKIKYPYYCDVNLVVNDGFPSHMGINMEGVSMSWRHHDRTR